MPTQADRLRELAVPRRPLHARGRGPAARPGSPSRPGSRCRTHVGAGRRVRPGGARGGARPREADARCSAWCACRASPPASRRRGRCCGSPAPATRRRSTRPTPRRSWRSAPPATCCASRSTSATASGAPASRRTWHPTMTIGTGYAGRSSVGENLRPDHLVNWVRLAHNADAKVPMGDFSGLSPWRASTGPVPPYPRPVERPRGHELTRAAHTRGRGLDALDRHPRVRRGGRPARGAAPDHHRGAPRPDRR